MARAKDNHTQLRYGNGIHANAKSSYDNTRRQIGCQQGTHQRPFPGTGFSYAAEISELIHKLHTGLHTHNQEMTAEQAGPSKPKKPFTGPYYAYHQFNRHNTEDCRDIHALAEQMTQKKDQTSPERSRGRNYTSFRSNELHRG
ncbi:hypothetical protein Fot_36245 [Forsythia ovata]|uniref:Uncharacterized protein n=1 Tax=Forsythia ovata TaxID=205694 RepID=A0ABD1SNX1_9LAMI